jgi:predicted DNA-binding protein (UPF0251 family)
MIGMTRQQYHDAYLWARYDHVLWLHEHEGLNYTQVGKRIGVSPSQATRLCESARFKRGDHRRDGGSDSTRRAETQ